MNEIFQKINTWFKKSMGTVSYERQGIRPANDWIRILIISNICVLVLALYASYLYFQINEGTLFAVPEDVGSGEVTINQKLLKKTVDAIFAREQRGTLLDAGTSSPADPSL